MAGRREKKIFHFDSSSQRFALMAAVICTASLLVVRASPLGELIDLAFQRPLGYQLREALGRGATLSPRLKIFGFDDYAFSTLGTDQLTTQDWADVIDHISAAKPQAIFIDKLFSEHPSYLGPLEPLAAAAARSKRVFAGAAVLPSQLSTRAPIDLTRPEFSLKTLTEGRLGRARFLETSGGFVYGPTKNLINSFAGVGHLNYPGGLRYAPLRRISDLTAIRHMALLAASETRVDDKGILVDGARVSIDRDGMAPVDLASAATYYGRVKSIAKLVERARKHEAPRGINAGDVVVLIPLMYTANVDLERTPLGIVPRGFLLTSFISSVLERRHLQVIGYDELWILIAGFAALSASLLRSTRVRIASALLLVVSTASVGLALFVFSDTFIGWVLPAITIATIAAATAVRDAIKTEHTAVRLATALRGMLPEERVTQVLKSPATLDVAPSERVITVMFIDIVSFSVAAERMPAGQVFAVLKDILNDLIRIIHSHRGVVDKTLGDGLLCFFGHSFGTTPYAGNHADDALDCALAIQRATLARNIAAARAGKPFFALRIGINSSSVYIGNVGSHKRFDFTIIGNGVIHAKRFESACESYCVLIGGSTLELASRYSLSTPGFVKRHIIVKHREAPSIAVEVNPFIGRERDLRAIRMAHLGGKAPARSDPRWSLRIPGSLRADTQFGEAVVLDVSSSGMCVKLETYLARGIDIELALGQHAITLHEALRTLEIGNLHAEVCWGKPDGKGFLHGIRFKNVNARQAIQMLELMRETDFLAPAANPAQPPSKPQPAGRAA